MNFNFIADYNLPFINCFPFYISSQYQTGIKKLTEKLENNHFSKEMIKHVIKISKDNYSCKYYDSDSIKSVTKYHHNSALKIILTYKY